MNSQNERESNASKKDAYDPYERDPGAGMPKDERVDEADAAIARQNETTRMEGSRLDDSTTAPVVHTGVAGQTARGQYGFDSRTGQGGYMDRTGDGVTDTPEPIDPSSDLARAIDEDTEGPAS